MKESGEEQELSRRYLLGELDDKQRRQFEERMMTDPDSFEHTLMAEDELLDDFVFEALPASEREKVARHLLTTPEQRLKVEVTRVIKEHLEETAAQNPTPRRRLKTFLSEHRSAVGWAVAATLVLTCAVGFWALKGDSLEQEITRLNSAQGSAGPPAYAVELDSERTREVGEAGADEANRVTIPPEARVVELRLRLVADNAPAYRVALELEKDEGQKLFTLDNLKAVPIDGGKLLTLRLPARILKPGYYQLQVSRPGQSKGEFSDLGTYDFRVVGKD